MAKIQLGKRPETFNRRVMFPMLDGTTGELGITYKYRTRREYGEFIDQLVQANRDAADKPKKRKRDPESFSMAEMLNLTTEQNAEFILQIATAWDLPEEFNAANVAQLADECFAAVAAIMDTYRIAVTEGRAGN